MNILPAPVVFQRGLSLLEILVALSISALLISTAIPGFSGMLKSNRATTIANTLLTAMQFARSEAIKRNINVTFCKSSDSRQCNGNWSDGWIIFADHDGDRRLDSSDGDRVLANERLKGGMFSIGWNGFRSDNYVQFSPLGFIHSNNGTFTICPPDSDPHHARAIIINRLGRARVSRDTDHDGIHEDGYGRPINCS